jgi:hypothetical protein
MLMGYPSNITGWKVEYSGLELRDSIAIWKLKGIWKKIETVNECVPGKRGCVPCEELLVSHT